MSRGYNRNTIFSQSRRLHTKRTDRSLSRIIPVQESQLRRVRAARDNSLKLSEVSAIIDEKVILDSLTTYNELAISLTGYSSKLQPSSAEQFTPAKSLLQLEEKKSSPNRLSAEHNSATREEVIDELSSAAYRIIENPNVFITPKVLDLYVSIQGQLNRPETLSEAFRLYASKPIPRPGTSPVRYSRSNPNKATSAIPLLTAYTALDAAIHSKNLSLCLDIINSSVSTLAFYKSKFIRRAMIPTSGLALAPVAAYSLASQISALQDNMSTQMATSYVFAGLLAYVGFTATIGVVALTTANDHMNRVTWASGTRLRDRWLKEDERAMLDKVACAWGFKDSCRRGEEEGPDWEALKELTGMRSMVLDRVELMEGME